MLRSTSIVRNRNYGGGGGKRQSGCSLSVFHVETRAMSWITSGSKKQVLHLAGVMNCLRILRAN